MASNANLKKLKFEKKLNKFGSTITRLTRKSKAGATDTTREAITFRALLVADTERKVYIYSDMGGDNMKNSEPYSVLCSPDNDVTWGDQLEFLGFIWRITEREIFLLDNVNIYMQLRAMRERPA